MAEVDKKPARAGKKNWREEKNGGVDARDERKSNLQKELEEMAKPAPGLRQIRGISRDGHLCKES